MSLAAHDALPGTIVNALVPGGQHPGMVGNPFLGSYESSLVVVMARGQRGCTRGGEQQEHKASNPDEAPWQRGTPPPHGLLHFGLVLVAVLAPPSGVQIICLPNTSFARCP